MPFQPKDIEPLGQVPSHTATDYGVSREGELIGQVRAPQVPGWVNAGLDPREEISRQLNKLEESDGFEKLAYALRATLDLNPHP